MSIHLTGSKPQQVHEVQERLDKYFDKKQAYETAQQKVNECAAENVPLTDIPAHEARYQDLLSKYSLAADELKCAANDVKKKTDSDHIDKYFHKRRHGAINKMFHAGPRDKSDIDSCYKGFLKELYKVACQISNTDYNTSIEQARAVSQKNAQYAQVQIEQIRKQEAADREYSSIHKTFPACQDQLILENPPEYLRQSALYQHKLLQNQDPAAALAFGKSWIKTIPNEATWEQVENMSLCMLEAANKVDNPDINEFRVAVDQWQKDHPLAEPPRAFTPAQATTPAGRRTHVLGLLYLKDDDLSPEAFQTYQNCSLLHPDENVWKSARAIWHVSRGQFEEANRLLAGLPSDDPSVIVAQQFLLTQQVSICRDHIRYQQFPEAEQSLENLPPDDPKVTAAKKDLADAKYIREKVNQATDRIYNCQGTEAEQLLNELPSDHPLVIQAKQFLTDQHHEWDISQKVNQVVMHANYCQWEEAKKILADLPQDHPEVISAQKYLTDAQNVWNISQKTSQAINHANHLLWLDAEQALDGLPQDDPEVIKAKKMIADALRERKWYAGVDIIALLLSKLLYKFIPSSYQDTLMIDSAQTGLQLISSPAAKRFLLPRLLQTSKPIPILEVGLSSGISIAADIVDFVFRRVPRLKPLRRGESFISSSVRLINTTGMLYSDPRQRSLLSYMSVASSGISAWHALDECRETHRNPTTQALSSTCQLIVSDLNTATWLKNYSDLLPVVKVPLKIRASFVSSPRWASTIKWLLALAGIGTIATYRFCFDYPYLRAASAMNEAEWLFYEGRCDDAKRVLKELEEGFLVSRGRPAVESYSKYLDGLIVYPQVLQDTVKYAEFLEHLNLALGMLNGVSYYTGIRLRLFLKKIEVAIRQQDKEMLSAVLKETDAAKSIDPGFDFLLRWFFHHALSNPTEAQNILKKMGISFPACFQPPKKFLDALLQAHADSLQEWGQLHLLSAPPSPATLVRWNTALKEFQGFYSKYLNTGVHRDLQYFKLVIAFVQTKNEEQTDALFKEFDAEIHDRFANRLVLTTRLLREKHKHKEATKLLERIRFNSFKHIELIQNYSYFSSLIYTPNLQRDAVLEQVRALEKCIAGLGKTDLHNELRVFFSTCRVVLNLDRGESVKAKELLTQEAADSKIPAEVAALLFARVYVLKQEKIDEKTLSSLQTITDLGPWQHHELFISYQAYLSCEFSPGALVKYATSVITQLKPIEQLAIFADHLEVQSSPWRFECFLLQGNIAEAKNLLTRFPELSSEFQKLLSLFLVHQGEQMRQNKPLRHIREQLRGLNGFFSLPISDLTQSYIEFLSHLENIEGNRDMTLHVKVHESLEKFLQDLSSLKCPAPESLVGVRIHILLQIGWLAMQAVQWKMALAVFESARKIGAQNLDSLINFIKDKQRA